MKALLEALSSPLAVLGLAGQSLFFMRFVVQWLASERARASVVPTAFWYFSLGGGALLLAYAIGRRDPVFILGQSTGIVIYLRNLALARIARGRAGNLPAPTGSELG